jgi:ribosomal protein S18 acetylase RimI-like enzyme
VNSSDDSSAIEDSSEFLTADISGSAGSELLTRLDAYYDTAPRATAGTEEHGALVLFVAERGWPFYARPRLDRDTDPTTDQIRSVLARQNELGVPQALEWVHESAPTLGEAARAAGMTVHACPLLVLESLVEPRHPNGEVRLMDADDAELSAVNAAINVAFGTPGTAVGQPGVAERDEAASEPSAALRLDFTIDALREGRTVRVGAFVDRAGAVGGGSHNPRGVVSEIVGVGVLPAFRRRGLAAAAAHLLARQALDHGVTTVFCGAESVDVSRVYESVGFRRIGTTCTAEID